MYLATLLKQKTSVQLSLFNSCIILVIDLGCFFGKGMVLKQVQSNKKKLTKGVMSL